MKGVTKILLLVGAGVAFMYYQTYKKIKNIKFELRKVSVANIFKSGVALNFWIKTKSEAEKDVLLDKVDLDLYLNEKKIGMCELPYSQMIEAGSDHDIVIRCTISYDVLLQLVDMIPDIETSQVNIYLYGRGYVDNLLVPIPKINVFSEDFKTLINDVISIVK